MEPNPTTEAGSESAPGETKPASSPVSVPPQTTPAPVAIEPTAGSSVSEPLQNPIPPPAFVPPADQPGLSHKAPIDPVEFFGAEPPKGDSGEAKPPVTPYPSLAGEPKASIITGERPTFLEKTEEEIGDGIATVEEIAPQAPAAAAVAKGFVHSLLLSVNAHCNGAGASVAQSVVASLLSDLRKIGEVTARELEAVKAIFTHIQAAPAPVNPLPIPPETVPQPPPAAEEAK